MTNRKHNHYFHAQNNINMLQLFKDGALWVTLNTIGLLKYHGYAYVVLLLPKVSNNCFMLSGLREI